MQNCSPRCGSGMQAAITRHDAGYATRGDLGRAFADWSGAHCGWEPDPDDTRLVVDLVTALAELLRICTSAGDRVVIDPPVYPPFAGVIQQLGRVVAPVPLARTEAGFAIDLAGVERAYRAGARAHILCSPHNPTGIVHSRDTLSAIAELAQRYGVWVLSDEVHAPMTLPGSEHVPFPSVSPAAAERWWSRAIATAQRAVLSRWTRSARSCFSTGRAARI